MLSLAPDTVVHVLAKFAAAWAAITMYECDVTAHEVLGTRVQDRTYHVAFVKPHLTRLDISAGDGRGSEAKRSWEAPTAIALPIRATASGWGFKWDSSWGGGKSDTVGPLPPNRHCEVASVQTPGARRGHERGQRHWERPSIRALSIRATAAGWAFTWDHAWGGERMTSVEPLAPDHSPGSESIAVLSRRVSAKLGQHVWEAPVVSVLPGPTLDRVDSIVDFEGRSVVHVGVTRRVRA